MAVAASAGLDADRGRPAVTATERSVRTARALTFATAMLVTEQGRGSDGVAVDGGRSRGRG
jgi:hypothetical protein